MILDKGKIEEIFDFLWPINRSLSGEGVRKSLRYLSKFINLKINEINSGTKVFDWTVPPEWNVNEAYIKNSKNQKVLDFSVNNLQLVGYSEPFEGLLSYNELKDRIYTIPEIPDAIPYVTSYYKKHWGFCMSHNDFISLDKNDNFYVKIDSNFNYKGVLNYGEALIKGRSNKEVLISTYICHPSMANNELSGPLVTISLFNMLKNIKSQLKYSYRFLFLPETIGSIYYLSKFGKRLQENLIAGYVINCIGIKSSYTFKKSRMGNSIADKAAIKVLKNLEADNHKVIDFFPRGSDERQYCSPGFNFPVASLMSKMYGDYDEYHTSLDNKELLDFDFLIHSGKIYFEICKTIETYDLYFRTNPNCEPQLGKYKLYPTLAKNMKSKSELTKAIIWLLNYSDGQHDLKHISEISSIAYEKLKKASKILLKNNLIR